MQTTVGYTQGTTKNPTYQQVCSGRTNHVEAVLLEYDPEQVTYEKLLEVFWGKHDPTQHNQQVCMKLRLTCVVYHILGFGTY